MICLAKWHVLQVRDSTSVAFSLQMFTCTVDSSETEKFAFFVFKNQFFH